MASREPERVPLDITQYRASDAEQLRTADLLRLMPGQGATALDLGARDGHFSLLMAERFDEVTALDLVEPRIEHPKVKCVRGNAVSLPFPDQAFDFVLCAEVLEHVPAELLKGVCGEIQRVARDRVLIGVPYKQDVRLGRTTCFSCGRPNPPWGHVNAFDEARVIELFSEFGVETVSFVGTSAARTNAVSAALMDFAGNPYGTYKQEEPCTHCGRPLVPPPPRNTVQLVATRLAYWARSVTAPFAKPHGVWMHVVFRRRADV